MPEAKESICESKAFTLAALACKAFCMAAEDEARASLTDRTDLFIPWMEELSLPASWPVSCMIELAESMRSTAEPSRLE